MLPVYPVDYLKFDEVITLNIGELNMLAHNAPLAEQLIYCPDTVSIETMIEMAEKADAFDTLRYRAQDVLDVMDNPTAHPDDVARELNALRAFLEGLK